MIILDGIGGFFRGDRGYWTNRGKKSNDVNRVREYREAFFVEITKIIQKKKKVPYVNKFRISSRS